MLPSGIYQHQIYTNGEPPLGKFGAEIPAQKKPSGCYQYQKITNIRKVEPCDAITGPLKTAYQGALEYQAHLKKENQQMEKLSEDLK